MIVVMFFTDLNECQQGTGKSAEWEVVGQLNVLWVWPVNCTSDRIQDAFVQGFEAREEQIKVIVDLE